MMQALKPGYAACALHAKIRAVESITEQSTSATPAASSSEDRHRPSLPTDTTAWTW